MDTKYGGFVLNSAYFIACKADDFFLKIVQFVVALSSDGIARCARALHM